MIIVNGMGLRIDENQRKQLEEASYKVPTLTHAATNPANNIVSVDNFDADYLMQYIENGNGLLHLCHERHEGEHNERNDKRKSFHDACSCFNASYVILLQK